MKKKKAMLLIELSVLVIASFIIFQAVSSTFSVQNTAIQRMGERNDVLLMMDSVSEFLKMNYRMGNVFNSEKLEESYLGKDNPYYSIGLEYISDVKCRVSIGVKELSQNNDIRIYCREVTLNE